jgi:hypothetical protein
MSATRSQGGEEISRRALDQMRRDVVAIMRETEIQSPIALMVSQ